MTTHIELRKLAEAAVAGPWVNEGGTISTAETSSGAWFGLAEVVVRMKDDDEDYPLGVANAAYIAAANPAVMLSLLDEIERLRGALKPFADLAEYVVEGGYAEKAPDDGMVVLTTLEGGIIDTSNRVKVISLRRAAEAMEVKP